VSSYEVKQLNLRSTQREAGFVDGKEILVLYVGDNSDISKEKAQVFRDAVARLKVLDDREKDTMRINSYYEVNYKDPYTA
jgi:hypothetical protein